MWSGEVREGYLEAGGGGLSGTLINKQESEETEDWEEALKVRGHMNTGIHFKKNFCVHYLLCNSPPLNLMTQNTSHLLGLRSSCVILVVLLSWVSLC